MICKYPPIQGGVCADAYWTAQLFAELGHEVQVVTNASEVEDEYKLRLTPEDEILLTGFRKKNSIILHTTSIDKRHVFIPKNNPSVSKMTSLTLEVCKEFKPDFIWAYYLEPYGVTALYVSLMTGIPYTIRHAGSDMGRLIMTKGLKTLYAEVFRRAALVLTHERHLDTFREIGVSEASIAQVVSPRLPADLFYPEDFRRGRNKLVLGVYGKAGPTKGSPELISAMAILRDEGYPVVLKALWGGRYMADTLKQMSDLGLANMIELHDFIAHWHVPDFIRDCDVIMFLENRFRVTFHTPCVPLETLSCGRPLIVTREIREKQFVRTLLKEGENCSTLPAPLTPQGIVHAIKDMHLKIKAGLIAPTDWVEDSPLLAVKVRQNMDQLLAHIQDRLGIVV